MKVEKIYKKDSTYFTKDEFLNFALNDEELYNILYKYYKEGDIKVEENVTEEDYDKYIKNYITDTIEDFIYKYYEAVEVIAVTKE